MTDIFPSLLAAAGGIPDPAWHVDGANVLDVCLIENLIVLELDDADVLFLDDRDRRNGFGHVSSPAKHVGLARAKAHVRVHSTGG